MISPFKTIKDLIKDITDNLLDYTITNVQINGNNVDIQLKTQYFLYELEKYSTFIINNKVYGTIVTFLQYWKNHIEINMQNYRQILSALNTTYNPLHNYDKTSTITTNRTNTNTNNNTTEQTTPTQTEIYTNTYTSENLRENEKTISTGGVITSNSTNNDTGNETTTENTKGNIGVTTSAQMIDGELKIRQTNIYSIIVTSFIESWCF